MLSRQLEQPLGHTADAVLRGERDPVSVGLGQTAYQHPDQDQGGVRMVVEEFAELLGVQESSLDVVERNRRRRMRRRAPTAAISPINSPGPRIASITWRWSAPYATRRTRPESTSTTSPRRRRP